MITCNYQVTFNQIIKEELTVTKKSTKSKQVSIGKQEYINQKTGEVETFNVVSEKDVDFNFEKIWLSQLLDAIDVIGNKKMQVMKWLLANKNSENQIIGTQRQISKDCGVSYPIVNETLKSLEQAKAMKKVQSGVYFLNPEFMFKGSNAKRMNILLKYEKVDIIDHEDDSKALQDKGSSEGEETKKGD